MKKHLISALLALLLLLCLPLSAAAAHPVPDLTRKGSITITMKYKGKPVSGGSLNLYKVGDVHEDDGNYSFVPVKGLEALDYSDIQSPDLAKSAAKAVEEKKIAAVKTVTIGSNGTAEFSDLALGLYLVAQKTAASGYKMTASFLVSVPYLEDGAYVYNVKADPKTDLEREVKPTPTQKPSTPSGGGKLPQTGQLWWPVPVLICMGLGCIAVGLIRRREGSERNGAHSGFIWGCC